MHRLRSDEPAQIIQDLKIKAAVDFTRKMVHTTLPISKEETEQLKKIF